MERIELGSSHLEDPREPSNGRLNERSHGQTCCAGEVHVVFIPSIPLNIIVLCTGIFSLSKYCGPDRTGGDRDQSVGVCRRLAVGYCTVFLK